MRNFHYKLILIITICFLVGCSSTQETAGNYSYKTECIGPLLDGTQTVKAWGNGKNEKEAAEQAKKNALRDILFKGIIDGKAGCQIRPVVPEVNAQAKYERYFNNFFENNGNYKKFIVFKEYKKTSSKIKARERVDYGIILTIQMQELKRQMIRDGIIK